MTKLPPWLSAGQTIAWIAFGKATPAAKWADLPELQETRDWRAPRDLLLAALDARAKGKEWRAPPGEWWTTEEVLATIARLEDETRKDAAALAEELKADIARLGDGIAPGKKDTAVAGVHPPAAADGAERQSGRIGDAEARLMAAKADLRGKLIAERITAYGRRVGAAEHDAIRAEAFLRQERKITEEGTITVPDGTDEEDTDEEDTIIVPTRIEWTDVQFRTEDVLREWPEGGAQPEDRADVLHRWPAEPPSLVGGAPAVRQRFSEGALGGWFQLRVFTWPKDAAPPSEAVDLAAARACFDDVPRDVFRTIRRQKVPANWRKSGPRRAGGK
jgi:hypothetical protein